MIAACPKCAARYRVDVARLRPEGARLRCSRCEAVFRVSPPKAPESPAPQAPPAVSRPAAPPPAPAETPARDRARPLVLIADPEVEEGKASAQALASWGLEPLLVHDGVDAILTIQRTLPRAVVLDAALPKMFGFQICELMKRNESLRSIQVVLVGAIHDRDRYRRPPDEIYGADAYIERPQLPDALRPILEGFGLPVGEAGAAAAPAPASESPVALEPPPPPAPTPAEPAAPPAPARAPAPAPASSEGAEVQKAERLARIVVSDIVLYNEEKFAAAVAAGNVLEAMEPDMAEGRALFRQRIDERVRESRDFLAEELLRVARQRGMR